MRVEDFAYNQITSMEYKTGLLLGEIIIYSAGDRVRIEYCDKSQVQAFVEYVRARMSGQSDHASAPQQNATRASNDTISQLERLADLKERGILTDEEFQAQKRKILEA